MVSDKTWTNEKTNDREWLSFDIPTVPASWLAGAGAKWSVSLVNITFTVNSSLNGSSLEEKFALFAPKYEHFLYVHLSVEL